MIREKLNDFEISLEKGISETYQWILNEIKRSIIQFKKIKCFIYSNNEKKALITGILGQDGAYLAQFLISKIIKFMVEIEEPLAEVSGDPKLGIEDKVQILDFELAEDTNIIKL